MGSVVFGCGCSVTSDMYSHQLVSVTPCSRHRRHEAVAKAIEGLREAMRVAHADVSPMQIEQEERSGEDRRAS